MVDQAAGVLPADPFRLKRPEQQGIAKDPRVHVYGKHEQIICDTESRGYKRNPAELQLNATEGFIPLWSEGSILRWRFQEQSLSNFESPNEVKAKIEELFALALEAWGDAVPVSFTRDDDAWDFQIVVQEVERCNAARACVLASAFFPDAGRHDLVIYPTLFKQDLSEQIETIAHELGHVFGLRHWFAPQSEPDYPAEPFGSQDRRSIMNYGPDSQLTEKDKQDLKDLYSRARSGKLKEINGTAIRLVTPFHTLRELANSVIFK
ncbi:reprolysin-like metallopeptidase [Pseudomonas sp. C2B4]|uniref:reprolysin-like metallopeptidase n=1 Tax=Pseudomonas sp. C2B4 TaxID=2735270 RepID=UPI0015B61F93|nr:matrixin family metalloprotease [Pseudomonas sp. C2B4]